MQPATYAIAIGSNRPGRHGQPEAELRAAVAALGSIVAMSPIFATPPLGPSSRRYANAVAILESAESPLTLLARLKAIERSFGRRPGRRWGTRVIDLDIILWSGGIHASAALMIPHPAFRSRRFVLDPLEALVPRWRDPVTGLSVRQLAARVRAVDRRPYRS
ncbi:MAG: 2-amino-4-hydroxy-6-hydroxymethyldihydropteridine diphosphokinase [Sphingomonas sp.]